MQVLYAGAATQNTFNVGRGGQGGQGGKNSRGNGASRGDGTNAHHSPTIYAIKHKEEVDKADMTTMVVSQFHQEVWEQLDNPLRKLEHTSPT